MELDYFSIKKTRNDKFYCIQGYKDTNWFFPENRKWALDEFGNAMGIAEDPCGIAIFNTKEEALKLITKANKYKQYKII